MSCDTVCSICLLCLHVAMVAALTTAAAHDAGAAARPDMPGLRETVLQHREVLPAHAQVPS